MTSESLTIIFLNAVTASATDQLAQAAVPAEG